MCGIAGELRRDAPPDREALARMSEVLAPRGPDGSGLWLNGRAGLAHRRLSIIDLSERGAQPMVDDVLGLTIVFNGIIYNHRELRAELERAGHLFFSDADTEVLLKGWAEWGEGMLDRLAGMFAFCLVEHASGRAILARDRLGKKPLYLQELGDGGLRLASSLPALVAAGGVDTRVDPVALHHYLSFHSIVPAPRTILRGVRKLAPATVMVVEPDGRRRERRYWDPPFERAHEEWSAREWEEAVLDALRVAVRRRMVSDVPVGILLSGGLDSSLIVALLAEQGQRGLATFSVGFRDVGDAVAFYLLSEEVAKVRKVVQSGQGADEVFAGYYWYPPLLEAEGDGLGVYADTFFDRDHAGVASLTRDALEEDPSRAFAAEWFSRPGASTAIDRGLRLDAEVMLVDDPVKRVDNMTMAHGLEARTPFLDHELVELAAACPPELKLADGGKGILKRAARGVVPDAVIDRPKGYFPVPALSHLEGPVLELVADALRSDAARDRGLFREEVVEEMLRDPNAHRTNLDGSTLWQLGLLELWLQSNVG
jgi:asparagine synthase (glutamine-hydrolysing)